MALIIVLFITSIFIIISLILNYEIRFVSIKNEGLYMYYRVYREKIGYQIGRKLIFRYGK